MSNKKSYEDRKKKKENLNLNIEINDFGPIIHGKISLKPLTILIGPNNSGKSYTSILIYSILEILNSGLKYRSPFYSISKDDYEYYKEEIKSLKKVINQLKNMNEIDLKGEKVKKIFEKKCRMIFEKKLGNIISRLFGDELKELIRISQKQFKIKIDFESFSLDISSYNNKLNLKNIIPLDKNIKIYVKDVEFYSFYLNYQEDNVYIEIGKDVLIDNKRNKIDLIRIISDIYTQSILKNFDMNTYFLPAARSGILQGHRVLTAATMREIPYVGIKDWNIPQLSGVVANFISQLIVSPDKKGEFYEIAKNIENEILNGEIISESKFKYSYPESVYYFKNTPIPLHRASSSVVGLIPFIIFLKYYIKKGDFLIIEEPETHLHPKNQRILAKYLVRLIRKGINIIINTHSEYLLDQLSNFILISKMDEKVRVEKFGYEENDYLNFNEVTTYLYDYSKEEDGYFIKSVEITEEHGISDKEFMKIIDSLYQETVKLHRNMNSG